MKEYYFGELQQDRKMNVGEDESTTTTDAEKELLTRTDDDKRSARNGQETQVGRTSFQIVGSFLCLPPKYVFATYTPSFSMSVRAILLQTATISM